MRRGGLRAQEVSADKRTVVSSPLTEVFVTQIVRIMILTHRNVLQSPSTAD